MISSHLVVINDLYVSSVAIIPNKANTPLLIDTDAVLPRTDALKFFKTVSRRYPQVSQSLSVAEHSQFA